MPLHKLEDFDSDYRNSFDGDDIKGKSVYTEGSDEKIGTVSDVLVDEDGHFRYFVVDLGFWIFGKKVLLPVGRTRIDHGADRVYALGMTRQQAEDLPEFSDRLAVDYDYEEKVRGVYRPSGGIAERPLDTPTPLDATTGLGATSLGAATGLGAAAYQPAPGADAIVDRPTYNRDTYNYKLDSSLYDLNEQDHQTLRLYEERLVANKQRRKTGEVAIGKHVETETARVSVPVDKERVIVERVTPADAGRTVSPDATAFREGEVARMEIYEETADIKKEAFVREEVNIKKVVDHDTVEAKETIRREELDVNAPNLPIEER
ncbi:hypothetical protein NIES4075_19660 [Tolypothrix sp. NIES-4075]|uniref:DUF2382 domain-containing protein n=1 Tax=Tolypothrix sp. NIES-4075 TaxID=2005459 RepID=UPI000B5C8AB1|nr:DUF2382 domain-containing protein [Tolypothrix sp. NIES-4075]GAX40998.1 hypothetical protein NIES4075_19660 [Tolypothrix sp. NIES-4075]